MCLQPLHGPCRSSDPTNSDGIGCRGLCALLRSECPRTAFLRSLDLHYRYELTYFLTCQYMRQRGLYAEQRDFHGVHSRKPLWEELAVYQPLRQAGRDTESGLLGGLLDSVKNRAFVS